MVQEVNDTTKARADKIKKRLDFYLVGGGVLIISLILGATLERDTWGGWLIYTLPLAWGPIGAALLAKHEGKTKRAKSVVDLLLNLLAVAIAINLFRASLEASIKPFDKLLHDAGVGEQILRCIIVFVISARIAVAIAEIVHPWISRKSEPNTKTHGA